MGEMEASFRILRFRPEEEQEPVEQTYRVTCREDWSILEALVHIKDEIDGTLSLRCSCRMGVCGSCGMMVNGIPRLVCSTFVRDFHPKEMLIEPMAHFPIVRDLVVDLGDFMEKLKRVKPWLIRQEDRPLEEGEHIQSQAQVDTYRQFSMCINCALCYAGCPAYGLNNEFVGPAALALAYRYDQDSRDQGASQREEALLADEAIWSCTFVGECSVVCPKHVDPAAAIQRTKVAATQEFFKSFLTPWKSR